MLRSQKKRAEQLAVDTRRQINDAVSAAAKWREKASQIDAAVEQLRHGVVLLSNKNKIVVLNSAASYLLNLGDKVDLKDQSFVDLIRFPEMNQAIAAAKNGQGVQKVSVEVPIDGGVRSVKARVTKIETPDSDRLLVSLQDETESMLLDQMRREFVANTSHELKTPLAAIKGYAETVELAINDDPDAAQHFMRQINVECLRLEHLIEDMMQLARAQSDNPSLTISEIRLSDVIEQSLASNRPVAITKSIDLSFSCEAQQGEVGHKSAIVRADAEATLTIINNLISNAIRYTPNGGKVTVGIRDADQFYSVYVDDTGVGISPSDQKRVFERFYRVKGIRVYEESPDGNEPNTELNSELETQRGTGIGLSIVKQLTKSLGGKVHLSSAPGVGSRFEVLLPKA
ncbi:sensor histidine kinase [Rubripirellula obstinata]|uniref:sensor histidine kinase n=1 Tax=Rubripirellula obstinata TaxID=406547 RepID=UPI0013577692|nr:ATP-binding protein [Rubripirellula obstinata]